MRWIVFFSVLALAFFLLSPVAISWGKQIANGFRGIASDKQESDSQHNSDCNSSNCNDDN